MEINWPTLAGNIVVGIVVAIVSARITVHYALRRFYSEKWWEKKPEAYGSIVEALHHMKNHADVHMEHDMRGSEPSEETQKELSERFHHAHAEVRKRADIGTFVISDEAVKALHMLEKDLEASDNTQGWYGHLQLEYDAVKKCLVAMREIAKNDLGLPK